MKSPVPTAHKCVYFLFRETVYDKITYYDIRRTVRQYDENGSNFTQGRDISYWCQGKHMNYLEAQWNHMESMVLNSYIPISLSLITLPYHCCIIWLLGPGPFQQVAATVWCGGSKMVRSPKAAEYSGGVIRNREGYVRNRDSGVVTAFLYLLSFLWWS